jgi:hypothetical protein
MMRRSISRVALVATGLMGLVLAGCGSGASSGTGTATNTKVDTISLLTSAPIKTTAAKTAKMAMTVNLTQDSSSSTPIPNSLQGDGSFDFTNHRGEMSMKAAGLSLQLVLDRQVAYMHIPQLAQGLGGKQWLKIDLASFGKAIGASGLGNALQGSTSDPTAGLNFLKGVSGPITTVGHESVRGVTTTHYRATIDANKVMAQIGIDQQGPMQEMLKQLGNTPVDVWIDGQGRVRREQSSLTLTASGASTGGLKSAASTVEFYDFGSPVTITVPPADQVADFSQLFGQLGSGTGK